MIYKTISPTESQVGKYIDINGDGIPEGVIFADLAVGGKGKWGKHPHHGFCQYEIPIIKKEFKDYVIIDEYEDKINGKQDVLTPILDGEDRFYIMALQDVNLESYTQYFCATWYNSAYYNFIENYYVTTSNDFGTGKQNTLTMINNWNNESYGEQNTDNSIDIWGIIQTQVNDGWFVPSKDEWSAFGANLKLTKNNFSDKGFKQYYWSSSLYNDNNAYFAYFSNGFIDVNSILVGYSIRLAKTI